MTDDSAPDSSRYEQILERVRRVPVSTGQTERRVTWIGKQGVLGLARNHQGALELVFAGSPLAAQSPAVSNLVRLETVTDAQGSVVPANVLTLERGGHMDSVAALVCHELIEAGVLRTGERDRAFAAVSALIEMAIDRSGRGREVITGLAGELYVLAELAAARPSSAVRLAESWAGYAPSTRDIQLGAVGIEVKTTAGSSSTHHIQGTRQVDLGTSVGGEPETHLYLMSLGITWLAAEVADGVTLASLTQSITQGLGADEANRFRAKARQYGAVSSLDVGDSGAAWKRPFKVTFARLYDLTDERIEVVRASDVAEKSHVVSDSVRYRIEMPEVISPGLNPSAGIENVVAQIAADAGLV